MGDEEAVPEGGPLRCGVCGRAIRRGRRPGTWAHTSRGGYAACDLDGDHVPVPEGPAPPDPRLAGADDAGDAPAG